MKKFNLFNEIIILQRTELLNAINSNKEFAITYDGNIIYENLDSNALIYRGTITQHSSAALTPQKSLSFSELLGNNYRVVEDEERILIKAAAAWQDIIGLNIKHCDYDDTTADGIAEFLDTELEDIGWQATEFNIKYRELVDVIEKECDGLLLCIEQEEPYQFSGMGFIFDHKTARKRLFEFCKSIAIDKIKNDPDFKKEHLSDDEEEAATFFGAL
ncbi:MAG: hypothetical protein U9P71_00645 [Campylobacterota bacterium]|nr:hypothetical protein [Campylobacterota bacterium]